MVVARLAGRIAEESDPLHAWLAGVRLTSGVAVTLPPTVLP